MSADNWTTCPRCYEIAIKGNREAIAQAEASYGKVPKEEFLRAMSAIQVATAAVGNTLREDYELGVDRDGVFTVSYSCSCDDCGFDWSFKHSEKARAK